MNSNKKKQKTSNTASSSASLEISSNPNIEEAECVIISSLSPDVRLEKLNAVLLLTYFRTLCLNKLVKAKEILNFSIYGQLQKYEVISIKGISANKVPIDEEGSGLEKQFLISKKTLFKIINATESNEQKASQSAEDPNSSLNVVEVPSDRKHKQVSLLGGLDIIIEEIKTLLKISLNQFELFLSNGLTATKGILIQGPPGVGKSTIIKVLIKELREIKFLTIESKAILSKFVGESEKKISDVFKEARKLAPCVIVIDDIHILCNKKELGSTNSYGIMTALLNEIDGLDPDSKVMVIGITSQPSSVDPLLRRAGRLEKDIKIEVPQQKDRKKILELYLKSINHDLSEIDVDEINNNMNGFTGADVVSLLRESVLKKAKEELQGSSPEEIDNKLVISKKHIEKSLSDIHPTGLKDIIMEIPKVLWTDIGGYEEMKKEVKQVIEWPLKHPEAFLKMGIKPSKGILLYGPPGCSKTMIAKAIATESSLNFIAIKGPELFSKYVGDSEKAIRDLFKRARLCSPTIIFFDEIDAIATQRSVNTDVSERVLIQLLIEMDGIESLNKVIIVAATNRPDILDIALTRPGRFDHMVYVPPPDIAGRREIFKINIEGNKMPVTEDVVINELSEKSNGYSGAEICLICREAGLSALSRDINTEKITMKDFDNAFEKVKPRITKELLKFYIDFKNNKNKNN